MSNESVRGGGGVKQHSSGVKHFLKLVKKNLGGLPPYPPPIGNPPMVHYCSIYSCKHFPIRY